MNKTVQPLFNMHIRPLEPKDFGFIRSLASEFPTFTVPSEYLLWFFSHFHPDFCRVLEDESGSLKAYLLAMPTSDPPNGMAIWQAAASASDQPFALEYFAAYLRDLLDRTRITFLFFPAEQTSASTRFIRLLAKRFGDCEVATLNPVSVGQGEHEFRIVIRRNNNEL
jgi:hypothetical protein